MLLKSTFESQHGTLSLYEVNDPLLTNFHTTKKQRAKGIYKVPPAECLVQDVRNAEDMFEIDESVRRKSSTLYQRTETDSSVEPVSLADFKVKKMIGTGSFGKVYLVQKIGEPQLYAMKSIRKDWVLKHDSLESIKLEKDILLKSEHPFLVKMVYVFQDE